MKKRCTLILAVMLIGMLLTSCGIFSGDSKKNDGELETLRSQVENLQKELSEAKEQAANAEKTTEELNNMTAERDSLQQQLTEMTQSRDSLQQQLTESETNRNTNSEGLELVELLFPKDGKMYHGNENIIFYSDSALSEKVGTGDQITFVSKEKYEGTSDLDRDMKVWISRSESGLVFSTNKPDLKEIKTE